MGRKATGAFFTPPRQADALAIGTGVFAVAGLAWLTVAYPALINLEGAVSARGLAVLSGGLALGALFLRFPAVALCALVAFVYLNLSEVLVRRHHVPSLLQVSFVPLALAALWSARARGRWPPRTLTVALAALLGACFLSTVVAADSEAADWRVLEHLKGFAIFLVAVMLMQSGPALRQGAWALVGSAACIGGLALIQIVTENFGNDFGGLARIKQAHIHGTTFEPRIAGPLGDPNFFAQILVLALPVALSLAWSSTSRRSRALAAVLAAIVGTACLFTYSRGGVLGLGAVLALTALWRGVELRKLTIACVLALPLAWIALPAHFADRLTTLGEFVPGSEEALRPDSSFQERKLFAAVAWQVFTDRPLLGVGAGNYATHFLDYTERVGSDARLYVTPEEGYYPHNLYLELAAETGVVGLVAFTAVCIACFASLSAARRALAAAGDRAAADLASACAIALIGYLLTSLFLHGHFIRYLWLMFGFTGALHNLATRRSERMLPGVPPAVSPPDRAVPLVGARGEPAEGHMSPADGVDAATLQRQRPHAAPLIRSAVAVVVSRFPLVTETFILREIIEMERQGQPVRLVPLIRETPVVAHREAQPWVARSLYVPFWSHAVAAANLRMLCRRPRRYLGALARVLVGSLPSPNFLVRSLALFPKSVCLAERLEREGIRHVHAHFATHPATTAWIVSMMTGAGFSVTVHAHDIFVRRTLLRPKLRAASFIRTISRFNRDFLVCRYPEVARKTVVIHVGLDPAQYDGSRHETTDGSTNEEVSGRRIISVASLRPYKGLSVLIDACRILRGRAVEFTCDIVGEGPLRAMLTEQIRRAGLEESVALIGAKPQHEVAAILRGATLLVQPSIVAPDGQMEGIPVAIMEGMATSLPVVASSLSGIPEAVIDGETGRLVEPGNADALASAIEAVLRDPPACRRMGREGRRMVEREFRIDLCVERLLGQLDAQQTTPVELPPVSFLATQHGVQPPVLGLRRFHDGRDARVGQVIVPAGTRPDEWVIKGHKSRPGESRPATERARREYDVLCRLAGSGYTERRVPRPLLFDSANACVVMEPCHGERLDDLIRSCRSTRADLGQRTLETAIKATGEWLRYFHEATASAADPSPVLGRVIEGANRDLESCSGRTISTSLAAVVRSQLGALRSQLAAPSMRLTMVHRDFWPGNIFVDGSTVQAIDFEGVDVGMPYEDVAYFLVQLELFHSAPLRRHRFERLAGAFLRGYLPGASGFDWAAYELCRVVSALQILAATSPPPRFMPAGAWRRRRVLRAIIAGGLS